MTQGSSLQTTGMYCDTASTTVGQTTQTEKQTKSAVHVIITAVTNFKRNYRLT